jgi:hypothetical protein
MAIKNIVSLFLVFCSSTSLSFSFNDDVNIRGDGSSNITSFSCFDLEEVNPDTINHIMSLSLQNDEDARNNFIATIINWGKKITLEDIKNVNTAESNSSESFLFKLSTAINNLGEKKFDLLNSFDIVNYDPEADKFKLWAKSFSDSINNGTLDPISSCSLQQFIPEDAWFYSITEGVIKLILNRKDGHLDLFYGLWKQSLKTKESLQEAIIHLYELANDKDVIYPYWEAGMFAGDFLKCIYEFAEEQLSDKKILINYAKQSLANYKLSIKSHLIKLATEEEFSKHKENELFKKNLQKKYSYIENQTFENFYVFYLYDFARTVNNHMKFGKYNPCQEQRSESEMVEDMKEGFDLVSALKAQLEQEFMENIEVYEIVQGHDFMSLVKTNRQIVEQDDSEASAYRWRSEFGFRK